MALRVNVFASLILVFSAVCRASSVNLTEQQLRVCQGHDAQLANCRTVGTGGLVWLFSGQADVRFQPSTIPTIGFKQERMNEGSTGSVFTFTLDSFNNETNTYISTASVSNIQLSDNATSITCAEPIPQNPISIFVIVLEVCPSPSSIITPAIASTLFIIPDRSSLSAVLIPTSTTSPLSPTPSPVSPTLQSSGSGNDSGSGLLPVNEVLTNDSVIGEPLFVVPLLTNSSSQYALCYEVYGSAGTIFNLISDRCVSVNALYSPMADPEDGNIITSVGILAVDNTGQCIGVTVSVTGGTNITIGSTTQQLTGLYSRHGVSVSRRLQRVRVSVPNCESVQLVMWLVRSEGDQQLRITITRGVNLRPTSHGLIGQFWNTPAVVQPYHVELRAELMEYFNQSNLFLVSLSQRQFAAELFHRSWDLSPQSCLYAGSSQGGALSDIPGPRDSVIEGRYTQYSVTRILDTEYTYTRFDRSFCTRV